MDLSWIDGRKTYLVAIVLAVLAATAQFGNLSPEAQEAIQSGITACIAAGFAALRSAIAKQVPPQAMKLVDPLLIKAEQQALDETIKLLQEKKKALATQAAATIPVPQQVVTVVSPPPA